MPTDRLPTDRPSRLVISGQDVEIRRSARRKRTVEARFEDGVIVIHTPAHMSGTAEREAIESLVQRLLRKQRSARNDGDLMRRAIALSRAYVPGAPRPSSVRWVSNMSSRWGSCSVGDASIRLSDAMLGMPQYVIDAVLLHEVAHLVERGHGPAFKRIIEAYPNHEKAQAYLAGASFGARQRPGQLPASSDTESDGID